MTMSETTFIQRYREARDYERLTFARMEDAKAVAKSCTETHKRSVMQLAGLLDPGSDVTQLSLDDDEEDLSGPHTVDLDDDGAPVLGTVSIFASSDDDALSSGPGEDGDEEDAADKMTRWEDDQRPRMDPEPEPPQDPQPAQDPAHDADGNPLPPLYPLDAPPPPGTVLVGDEDGHQVIAGEFVGAALSSARGRRKARL